MVTHHQRLTLPQFDAAHPADRFRSEAHEMAAAYLDTLLSVLPQESISGIYVKGSAYKRWDSMIDYVPEFSDVDLHIRFHKEDDGQKYLGTLDQALSIAQGARSSFLIRAPNASHFPRPQLIVLNELEKLDGYCPSPVGLVHTLYGEPYVPARRDDYAATQPDDAQRFIKDAEFLDDQLPMKVIDRPGLYAWRVVWLIVWRVGPVGPRLLTHLGLHPYDAWSLNRTGIVEELITRGKLDIAQAYVDFYLAGWDGYRSDFRDGDAAFRALNAASRLFSKGKTIIPD